MKTSKFECRSCGSLNYETVLDLGSTPLANRLLTQAELGEPEPEYPLRTVFCKDCSLLQITETVEPEVLFRNYLYFSSFSETLLQHADALADSLIQEKELGSEHLVIEAASNDGYLLKFFKEKGIQVLGVEPATNIAAVARENGIATTNEFFGSDLAERLVSAGKTADVFIGNNVLAHVADLNGFVQGITTLLSENGTASIEVPYVRDLIEHCEFDTIYHEHLCYFGLHALDGLFQRHGLTIYDVKRVPIHGGTIRLWAGHTGRVERRESVNQILKAEAELGMTGYDFYRNFASQVERLKSTLCQLLKKLESEGSKIAAYGASAKGSTLLNYLGISSNQLDFVADRSTVKQGLFTPGTRIPIIAPEALEEIMPDYVLLLTWNFRDEILRQQAEYLERGGKFIVPVPRVEIIERSAAVK